MKFSEETIDLILDIKEFTGGKLKNEFELSALIEFTHTHGKDVTFSEIIFKAKFLKGLARVMAASTESKENSEKFLAEYTEELASITALITKGLENSDTIISETFKSRFFELTPESFMNMNPLIEDLALCKDYFNDLKNK